jgi:hypothetical protein
MLADAHHAPCEHYLLAILLKRPVILKEVINSVGTPRARRVRLHPHLLQALDFREPLRTHCF